MEDFNVCTLLTAGSDSHSSVSGSPNTSSVVGADKVINSKIDSTLFKGEQSDEEFLKAFLTDTYCHVCSTQLKLESHRATHYEGKKHAQKVQVFLEAARAEKTTGAKRAMPSDKNRFCKLCNMVFSSSIVAKSHYQGKVHAKNLRKQTLQPSAKHSIVQAHENLVPKLVQEENVELHLDPTPTSTPPFPSASCGTDVDLKDPNKYCSLCVALFNNPQKALEHYNGHKHQKNEAREELLRELGEDVQQ
ncbi:zinc finger matrin-type protein 4, partial [Nematolebias whitei]|uniref:zinc finger matrin-type protein 4 n=1 Tax=Nematolebias whitei TaxID=451745 RepID=UPI00189A9A79